MSVFGLERSETVAANKYDHAINLIDTTKAPGSPREPADIENDTLSPSASESGTLLGRQFTKGQGTLRKELARRKYAKYQKDKDADDDTPPDSGSETGDTANPRASQDSERRSRLRDKIPFKGKKPAAKARKEETSFIDVLYENQRGSFFCGISLYSSKSLLNFDPSPWQTANFQDSAVNITNFQLPDPSWTWDWKTWYVDMSRDVDEEGWEYSFSFNKAYAWHGNHPWLFSFTRRRRWLRRRLKLQPKPKGNSKDRAQQAHLLNEDYFTIHAARKGHSRESSADRTTTHRSSFTNARTVAGEDESELDEISNVAQLLKALRRARVDREKISAFKKFLDEGGDELFYLADAMPEITDFLVHQTSLRQLQTSLLESLDQATTSLSAKNKSKGKELAEERNAVDEEAAKRRVDNILKAVHAAGVHVNDLDYWTNLRPKATSSETDPTNETHALDATRPTVSPEGGQYAHSEDDEVPVREEIKGIPDDAHVSKEPRLRFAFAEGDPIHDEDRGPLDKGKGKA